MKKVLAIALAVAAFMAVMPAASFAQQKIGYIDSDYILKKTPEYLSVQNQVDRMGQEWQSSIEKRRAEVDELFKDFQARELLFTEQERQRRRDEIIQAEEEVQRLQMQYFGPEGELFTQQEQLMRPVQERVLAAVEVVAKEGGYDYVFDKSGDFLFLYSREQFNLSDRVLQELGIEVEGTTANK